MRKWRSSDIQIRKEGPEQSGNILIVFSGGIRGNELNGYPVDIPSTLKQGFLLIGASMVSLIQDR